MNNERLIKALTKAGATVAQVQRGLGNLGYRATLGGRELCWFTQESMSKPGTHEAVCVRTPSPMTDAQTDCFCDTYHDTIKGAVASLTR